MLQLRSYISYLALSKVHDIHVKLKIKQLPVRKHQLLDCHINTPILCPAQATYYAAKAVTHDPSVLTETTEELTNVEGH